MLSYPSFGYHPWYIKERTSEWQSALCRSLDKVLLLSAKSGWIAGSKILIAATRGSICLANAAGCGKKSARQHPLFAGMGKLLEICRTSRTGLRFCAPLFRAPQEMIEPLARLGAYSRCRDISRTSANCGSANFSPMPLDRLLIETDAPDQLLPEASCYRLTDPATASH